jgi:hypothetical protein
VLKFLGKILAEVDDPSHNENNKSILKRIILKSLNSF